MGMSLSAPLDPVIVFGGVSYAKIFEITDLDQNRFIELAELFRFVFVCSSKLPILFSLFLKKVFLQKFLSMTGFM